MARTTILSLRSDAPGNLPSDAPLTVGVSRTSRHLHLDILFPRGTHFYGVGERGGPLLRSGSVTNLWATDIPGYSGTNRSLYKVVPWVLAVLADGRAVGMLLDSTWPTRVACGVTTAPRVEFDTVDVPTRLVVFDEDDPAGVVAEFTAFGGLPPRPPRWALGYHQCRYSYSPADRVREVVKSLDERELPCDAIWLDIGAMDAFQPFTWDPEGFGDLPELVRELHLRGLNVVAIVDPAQPAGGEVARALQAEADVVTNPDGTPYLGHVWGGASVFPDFSSPRTRDWWAARCADFVRQTGLDGLWCDMNEPADLRSPTGTLPLDARHVAGTHEQEHNRYGLLMTEATQQGLLSARSDRRPFVLTRATFAGGQRFAFVWTGDNRSTWEDLAASVPMLLNLGLSGLAFAGADVGGFEGDADAELFVRWMELAAFTPFFRAHSIKGSVENAPYNFGPGCEAACRSVLGWRRRLLPYLEALADEAARTGVPPMRPRFFSEPANIDVRGEDESFLLGDDLLVVPVLAPGIAWHAVPLPPGRWVHLPTGASFEDEAHVDVPWGVPAIFQRAGSAIPMLPDAPLRAPLGPHAAIELSVVPDDDGRAVGVVVDDDGEDPSVAPARVTVDVHVDPRGALALTPDGALRPALTGRVVG